MNKILPLLIFLLLVPLASAQQQIPDLNSLKDITFLVDNIFLIILVIYIIIGLVRIGLLYRREGTLPFLRFLSNKKSILVVLISIVGLVVFIMGMFQPWYTLKADIQSDALNTGGVKDLVSIDGFRGVTVDKTLLGGQELPTRTNVNLLLFVLVISAVFGLVGAKSLRSFGKNNLKSGIITLVVFIAAVSLVIFLPSLFQAVKSQLGGGELANNFILDSFVADFTQSMSSAPLSGEYVKNFTVPIKAYVKLDWALQLGMYLFLVAAIIKIICGVMGIVFSKGVDKKNKSR